MSCLGRSNTSLALLTLLTFLGGCSSDTDRAARTGPESPLLSAPRSTPLATYKELGGGRSVKDVSSDGKLILVASGNESGWAIEIVETRTGRVIAHHMGAAPRKLPDITFVGFLPGSDFIFIEDFIFNKPESAKHAIWDFRKDTVLDCRKGMPSDLVPADLQHTVAGSLMGLTYSRNSCMLKGETRSLTGFPDTISPDGRHYLTLGPQQFAPYKEIEIRNAIDFEIVDRIESGGPII